MTTDDKTKKPAPKKADQPPTAKQTSGPTPAQVICRVTGCGRFVAEALVGRMGADADKLPGLYAKDKVDEIHRLIEPPQTVKPAPATE